MTGYGYGGGGVAAVEVVNRHFNELLSGRTLNGVEDIARIWDELYFASLPYGRRGIAIMALSGVDLGLWDVVGKAERKPVAGLLTRSPRGAIRAYATGADTEWYAELGFTAHKMAHRWTGDEGGYDSAEAAAQRARAAFGDGAEIMFDVYMSWDRAVTLEMARRLRAYNVFWFEDTLTPDALHENARLRPLVHPINLAGGEHEFTHHGFAEVARAGAYDIWQPDITWCGGITAGLRILDIARTAGAQVVPHRGGEVWGLHFIAATDCEDMGEVLPGARGGERDELWVGEPQPAGGYLTLNDEPGFGVRPNEDLL